MPPKTNRNQEVVRLYESGQSVADLSRHFKVTKQRIRSLLQRAGVARTPRQKRDQFVGLFVAEPIKQALRDEAKRRGLSISQLSSDTLSEMLESCGYLSEAAAIKEIE